MGCHSYADLKRHIGHKIVVSCYGDRNEPQNVAVECETCYEVLMDFDKEEKKMNKKYCGECHKMLKPTEMWSDFTCKKCAEKLELDSIGMGYEKGNFDKEEVKK